MVWLSPLWIPSVILLFLNSLLSIAQPFLMKFLIDWLQESNPSSFTGYMYLGSFGAFYLIRPFIL